MRKIIMHRIWILCIFIVPLLTAVLLNNAYGQDYCASRGNSVSYEWIQSVAVGSFSNFSGSNGGYADYSYKIIPLGIGSHPIILTPGFRSYAYLEHWKIWIDLNQDSTFTIDEVVYSGSSSTTIMDEIFVPSFALPGDTRMRISMRYGYEPQPCGSFSYGEVEDYTVHIEAEEPEEDYCESRGNSVYYEWIEGVTVGSSSIYTGPNNGYSDFSGHVFNLSWDSNPIILSPGFRTIAYLEYWKIWIDLNQDKVFSTDEVVYSGSASTAITGEIILPPTALPGDTRMRISMRYGGEPSPCGSFAYGEVEDYTVHIPAEDMTSPEVTFVSPPDNATEVDVETAISAIFSEPMNPETMTQDTFIVTDGMADIAGTINYSGTTAIFTPASPLEYETTYTATITTGAADMAGNALAIDHTWVFTTAPEPIIPPEVTFVSPLDNATEVDVETAISAIFSEPMDPETITQDTFIVTDGMADIAGMINYSGTTATFTPASPLEYETTYTATITTGALDLTGTPLMADYTWSFTTGSAPVNTYEISGQILHEGEGLEGATVTLSGDTSGVTVTNPAGEYTFGALGSGSYTVTPSYAGYVFTPQSTDVTVIDSHITGVNFDAELKTKICVPAEYPTIQGAVDAALDGFTILVADGTYTENVKVNKSLTILSETGFDSTTVIAAVEDDHVFEVTADYVTIEGFTAYGATTLHKAGICLGDGTDHCTIIHNRCGYSCVLPYNYHGIMLVNSSHNVVSGNICSQNTNGIWLTSSSQSNKVSENTCDWNLNFGIILYPTGQYAPSNNTLSKNHCYENNYGIRLQYSNGNTLSGNFCSFNNYHGIWLEYSHANTLSDNICNYNEDYGIWLEYSNHNTIAGNTCHENDFYGLYLLDAKNNNTIYLNNFSANTFGNVYSGIFGGTNSNTWHSPTKMNYYHNGSMYHGYLGNYYDDHVLIDSDGDGITDSDYDLPNSEPYDEYPLVTNSNNYFGETIHVPGDFPTIQAAIDAAFKGDIILVEEGTYNENVEVYKSLTILSESGYNTTTVVAQESYGHVFMVSADYVTIEGFTIYGATFYPHAGIYVGDNVSCCIISQNRCGLDTDHYNFHGIHLSNVTNSILSGNICTRNNHGIYLSNADDNILTANTCSENGYDGIVLNASGNNTLSLNTCNGSLEYGIKLYDSTYNTLSGNTCTEIDQVGISLENISRYNILVDNLCSLNGYYGIVLYLSCNLNTLSNNTCTENNLGILLYAGINELTGNTCNLNGTKGIALYSSNNTLSFNTCLQNAYGIYISEANDNTLYLNHLSDNTDGNVYSSNSTNLWRSPMQMDYEFNGSMNNGFLGNYYGDHILIDSDGDGITDSYYDLPGMEPDDKHPLVLTPDYYNLM